MKRAVLQSMVQIGSRVDFRSGDDLYPSAAFATLGQPVFQKAPPAAPVLLTGPTKVQGIARQRK